MEFSTHTQMNTLENVEGKNSITSKAEYKKSALPNSLNINDDPKLQKNIFLDKTIREMLDDFVLTWHKIILELLDSRLYLYPKTEKGIEWWDRIIYVIMNIIKIFFKKENLFHVGVGMVVASFFIYFIFVVS